MPVGGATVDVFETANSEFLKYGDEINRYSCDFHPPKNTLQIGVDAFKKAAIHFKTVNPNCLKNFIGDFNECASIKQCHRRTPLSGPEKCLEFVLENFPSKFDWYRLAEGAATKAASYTILGEISLHLGLEWIRVAVEIYEKMADHPSVDHDARVRLTEPAIAKRAQALSIWGSSESDPILSPKNLSSRFKSIVDISPEQLRAAAEFPHNAKVHTALLVTQFVEPLLQNGDLKAQLQDLAEYCAAAQIVRKNYRSRGAIGEK